MKYRDFVDGINSGKITKAIFSIKNYSHYRNCVVESKPTDPSKVESGKIIWFYLTPDGYEKKGFMNKIKENDKLFKIKNSGTFSLLQIWDRVDIHFVEYSDTNDNFPTKSSIN
ncbi:MAG: hypothetical protein J6K61_03785 [Clostridia bacterium]|nr:hypothetical protein [Clostridia bacterium]